MRLAVYGNSGERVGLKTFIERQGSDPKHWTVKPYCPCCGRAVHLYDAKGAMGFRKARDEVTKSVRRYPGFHHYKNDAAEDCAFSYAKDPRYAGLIANNNLDVREKDRNKEVFENPKMHAALDKVLTHLMYHLSGKDEISSADRKTLDTLATRQLYPLAGLAEHPWLLPYMQVSLFGSHERTFASGSMKRLVFVPRNGDQTFNFTDADGKPGELKVPRQLQLFFAGGKTGKVGAPFLGQGRYAVIYDISRESARNIVKPPHRSAPANGNNGAQNQNIPA